MTYLVALVPALVAVVLVVLTVRARTRLRLAHLDLEAAASNVDVRLAQMACATELLTASRGGTSKLTVELALADRALADARHDYNYALLEYRRLATPFPMNLVAARFGLRDSADWFAATPAMKGETA